MMHGREKSDSAIVAVKPANNRCAMASLPFEQPKLMAVAQVNEQSFAELLERGLIKIEEARLIEAKPRRI
jgi:hypothetical protein